MPDEFFTKITELIKGSVASAELGWIRSNSIYAKINGVEITIRIEPKEEDDD